MRYKADFKTIKNLIENREELKSKNFLLLSIAQKNWWAVYAHVIRLGAKIDSLRKNIETPTFSHSALGFWGGDQYYVIEILKKGAHVVPANLKFQKFVGEIAVNVTPWRADDQSVNDLIKRNSGKTYSVPLAIKSEIAYFPADNDKDESFCSLIAADNLEELAKKNGGEEDFIPGDNRQYTPTALYRAVNVELKFPLIDLDFKRS